MKRKMRGTALVLAGLMLLASTGCSSGGPAPNSHLEQRWDQEGSYTVIVCDE